MKVFVSRFLCVFALSLGATSASAQSETDNATVPQTILESHELAKDVFGTDSQLALAAVVVDGHLVEKTAIKTALPSGKNIGLYVAHAEYVNTDISGEMLEEMDAEYPGLSSSESFMQIKAANTARNIRSYAVRVLVDEGGRRSLVDGFAVQYVDEADSSPKTVFMIGDKVKDDRWHYLETVEDGVSVTEKTASSLTGGLEITQDSSQWGSSVFLKGSGAVNDLTGVIVWNDTPPTMEAASRWWCAWRAARWSFVMTGCIACTAACVIPDPSSTLSCPCAYALCCSAYDGFVEDILVTCEGRALPRWYQGVHEVIDTGCTIF